jgi:hypothetical protein
MIEKIRKPHLNDIYFATMVINELADAFNAMQTDDLRPKYHAKIEECNRLRQEIAVLKNQADPMFKAEPWPVKCKECKYYRDEVPRKTTVACFHPQANGDYARTLVGYENEIPKWCPLNRPEPKALRDGDAFIGEHGIAYVQVADKIRMASTNKVSSDIHIANILDLAAAVQRGEKVVTLDGDDEKAILIAMRSMFGNEAKTLIKLRAAMGGDK